MGGLQAALTGVFEVVTGRAAGFTRFRAGPADFLLGLAAMALAILIASAPVARGVEALGMTLLGGMALVLAELGMCWLLALPFGRRAAWPGFTVALLWCWAAALAVISALTLPLNIAHGAGGDPTGAQSGTLLLGGGFFMLAGLYLLWLNYFLLHRGLGLGVGGTVLGLLLMLVVLSVATTLQAAYTPVSLQP